MRKKYYLLRNFLNPSDENDNTSEPDLDDIINTLDSEDTEDCLPDPDEENICGPRPDIPSDTVILRHLSDQSLWAAHREGCMKENIASIDALTKAFQKPEVNRKKQKTL
jgi:hypothetical protein